jgi:hypothetical protein
MVRMKVGVLFGEVGTNGNGEDAVNGCRRVNKKQNKKTKQKKRKLESFHDRCS